MTIFIPEKNTRGHTDSNDVIHFHLARWEVPLKNKRNFFLKMPLKVSKKNQRIVYAFLKKTRGHTDSNDVIHFHLAKWEVPLNNRRKNRRKNF